MLIVARKPATIDEYLSKVRGQKRAALLQLRKTIRRLAPKAEECISYGIPAFRLDGHVVAGFAARSNGCSYYPFSGSTFAALANDLEPYKKTRGALHFDPGEPLPPRLVRKLLDARIAEIA